MKTNEVEGSDAEPLMNGKIEASNETKKCPKCNANMNLWEDIKYYCPECEELLHEGDKDSFEKFWESLK